ncbi:cytochrome P450 3A19-like [Oppia nitens]|uniref:cytochrome P450 3A19-like n=1 Tax=Oppia nitens TaxID=1686743 RepID=UPI0023D9E0F6|nr:cytochrome P450 3A19-like [Oppia nitens]XP_054161175.1 cytochrome P450 3A19-like [Oppia nitens]
MTKYLTDNEVIGNAWFLTVGGYGVTNSHHYINNKNRHTGITLRAGETIEFGIYAMHMNADYYPNPEQFNVDRFLPENRNQLTPYALLPLGLGPRQCIAKRFAQMLVKLTLATLVLKYRFNTCEQTDIPTKVHISSF